MMNVMLDGLPEPISWVVNLKKLGMLMLVWIVQMNLSNCYN